MHKTMKKLLARLEHAIGSAPIAPAETNAAFEMFVRTGELPANARLAQLVAERAVTGIEPILDLTKVDWAQTVREFMARGERPRDRVYEALLVEAIHGPGIVQSCARHALRALATAGVDLRKPELQGSEVPVHGSVGMQMLGIPERFDAGRHQDQFDRLMARIAELREQLPQGDQRRFAELRRAAQRFQHDGEAPADPRMLDAILVLGELCTLLRAAGGEDVEQELAAFRAATEIGSASRAGAVEHLQAMAVAGAFAGEDA